MIIVIARKGTAEYEALKHGSEALSALRDFGEYLHKQIKYSDMPDHADKIYETLFECLEDNHLDRDIVGF